MVTNEMITLAKSSMEKSMGAFSEEILRLRTGRANPSLIEKVEVDCYGVSSLLKNVASITASDPKTLVVAPWDSSIVKHVEKAIASAGLNLNPVTDGKIIRVPIPTLTAERRAELVTILKKKAEESRTAIRNIRRERKDSIRDKQKEKMISEDDEKKLQNELQKLTDDFINKINKICEEKEHDLITL